MIKVINMNFSQIHFAQIKVWCTMVGLFWRLLTKIHNNFWIHWTVIPADICTFGCAKHAIYLVQWALCNGHRALCFGQSVLCNVHCALGNMHCALGNMYCAVGSCATSIVLGNERSRRKGREQK